MKHKILAGMMLLAACATKGSMYSDTYTVNTVIPSGNPVGVTFSENITGADLPAGSTVSAVTVGLDISGGYNGGLVAYLVAPNGTLVMLLNQPGVTGGNPFGYGGSGMNVTLSDGYTSIDSSPETPGSLFTGTYGAAGSLASANGSSADGTWTLFFANLDSGTGSGSSELLNFTLNITAVPEPVNVALGIFGGLMALGWSRGMFRKSSDDKVMESVK